MTATTDTLAAALPHAQPCDPASRLMLFGIRQMGAHGLNDAGAAHAFVNAFGKDFRRPLVALRTLMAEMSTASSRPIRIAPWCCRRMTGDEATLLALLARMPDNPTAGGLLMADLLGLRDAGGVAATAHLLATAFTDLGLPLRG